MFELNFFFQISIYPFCVEKRLFFFIFLFIFLIFFLNILMLFEFQDNIKLIQIFIIQIHLFHIVFKLNY
jgi:hypothetical protein